MKFYINYELNKYYFVYIIIIYIILPQVYYIIIVLHVIHYSCIYNTYVKMWMSRGQCAWLVNKRLSTSHQRLNEEHLNNFEKCLVGFIDG